MADPGPSPLRARVEATAWWVSETRETAEDLAPRIGRSADWIRRRTGVSTRRIFQGDTAEQAARACRPLLEGGPPDLLINASLTPRQLIPDTSVFVARALGLSGLPCFSVHATCLSFLVGLRLAATLVHTGQHHRVLVVSSEVASVSRDLSQPESAALLGDGAAAAMIVPARAGGSALLAHAMHTFPDGAELTEFRGAGVVRHPNDPSTTPADNRFQMQGARIYRRARKAVGALLDGLLDQAGLRPDDLDLIVPHQASRHGLDALPRYGLPADRIVDILAEHGNCVAASIPMALAHAVETGRLHRGDRVLLVGTGAGLSVAGAVLRW